MATQPNALTLFNQPGGDTALPAYMQQFVDEVGTNIAPRTTVNSLSPEGKTWTISIDGQKTPLQRRNADGDLEPLPIMKVVALNFAKERGRQYYEGDYDPNKVSAPICWSDDGVTPDDSLPGPFPAGTQVEPGSSRKISAACTNCPMAVKGSKVNAQGKAVAACGQHRMLAVLPAPELGLPEAMRQPLRLKIAMTSDWDKQSPDQEQQGWLSWSRYVDWLNTRGCKHTALIVTKMKFDPLAAFPKIFFSAERPLQPEELAVIGPLAKSEEVKKLLGGTWTPAGVDGVPREQQTVATPIGSEPVAEVPATAQTQTGYRMADAATHTLEQYHAAGWTDAQLIAAGTLVPIAPPAEPAVVATPAPAPAPAPAQPAAVVVGEPTPATAIVAEPMATTAVASQPAAEAVVVVAEPATPVTSAPAQPAAPPPQQAPAQPAAPPPAAQVPEPPAAAAAAATASPAVSSDVPAEVADLLQEWGDPVPAAT